MLKSISKKILREFGLVGLGILFSWDGYYLLRGHSFAYWTLWIGIPLLFASVFRPFFLYYPYKLWMKLGYILGLINGKIILGLVFF